MHPSLPPALNLRFLAPSLYRSIGITPTAKVIQRAASSTAKRVNCNTPDARLQSLKDAGVTELYPRFQPPEVVRVRDFRQRYDTIPTGEVDRSKVVTITGRIRNYRDLSSKLIFYDLEEDGTRTQIVSNFKAVGGEIEEYKRRSHAFRLGDIISISGYPGRTSTGELSLYATTQLQLLSPCLHQLPENTTTETSLHNWHLDLLTSPTAAQTLRLRSRIIHSLRNHLLSKDFTEVSTPILSYSSGGALAKSFKTEAIAYRGRQLSLRIAPELWLKRLVIGGLDRVFEIGPQFRNERIDATHNPEFTTCEYYHAYGTLEDLMSETEELLRAIYSDIQGLPGVRSDINFSRPFKRIEFVPTLRSLGVDIPASLTTETLTALFTHYNLPLPSDPTPARLLDKLSTHFLEPLCDPLHPTFITHHPELLSPLSKCAAGVAQRCELFLAGYEIVNAYEEENDPVEQARKLGGSDAEFVEALEWGLPPTVGWGCGVDRLVMVLTGQKRIADVLAFGGLRGAVNQGGAGKGERRRPEEREEGV